MIDRHGSSFTAPVDRTQIAYHSWQVHRPPAFRCKPKLISTFFIHDDRLSCRNLPFVSTHSGVETARSHLSRLHETSQLFSYSVIFRCHVPYGPTRLLTPVMCINLFLPHHLPSIPQPYPFCHISAALAFLFLRQSAHFSAFISDISKNSSVSLQLN